MVETTAATSRAEEMAMATAVDIHELFCHYDALYFHGSLGACSVSWIQTRRFRYPGTCRFQGGGCDILLSKPLFKFRSADDLKNILIHEMIHAYLWFETKNKDHSDHGPNFLDMMNSINSSTKSDHQRPIGGYNITTNHQLTEELDGEGHVWTCESCGNLFSGAVGGTQHEKRCSSCCYKTKERSELDAERRDSKVETELTKYKSKELLQVAAETTSSHEAQGAIVKLDGKKSTMITNFLPSSTETKRYSGANSVSQNESDREWNFEDSKAIEAKYQSHAVGSAPRNPSRMTIWKQSCARGKRRKVSKYQKEYTVISGWLDLYADEEDDEYVEPLVNKRTERRKKQKQLKLKGRSQEFEEGKILVDHRNERRQIPILLVEKKAATTTPSDPEEDTLNAGKVDMINYFAPSQLKQDQAIVCSIVSGPHSPTKRECESSKEVSVLSAPITDDVVDISDD